MDLLPQLPQYHHVEVIKALKKNSSNKSFTYDSHYLNQKTINHLVFLANKKI